MTHPSREQTYEVYLAADVAETLGLDSPVETTHIDYYDSGLWVTLDAGRDFFPYRHVLGIRERPSSGAAEATAGEEGLDASEAEEPADDPADAMD